MLHVGEGGTFALLQGLYPRSPFTDFDRTLTSESGLKLRSDRNGRGQLFLTSFKWLLYFWSLFGTSLTLSDGILTPGAYIPCSPSSFLIYTCGSPAVSVTSAVGGLAVAKPSVSNHIISISVVRFLSLVTSES